MFKFAVLIISTSLAVSSALAENIPTRFGPLKINDENILLFKNRPLKPEVQGNNSLSVVGIYQLGNSDVVLVQDNGGTACPAQFYFVTVSTSGAKATSAFGTCSDTIEAKQTADSISVTMPGLMGPFESKAAQKKAAKEKHVYVFKDGVLNENKNQEPARTIKKKLMGDAVDENPNAKPNGKQEAKNKALNKRWQDENGFVHYPDGSISSGPVD